MEQRPADERALAVQLAHQPLHLAVLVPLAVAPWSEVLRDGADAISVSLALLAHVQLHQREAETCTIQDSSTRQRGEADGQEQLLQCWLGVVLIRVVVLSVLTVNVAHHILERPVRDYCIVARKQRRVDSEQWGLSSWSLVNRSWTGGDA